MAKYLVKVNYSVAGAKGLHHDGGSKRRAAAEHAAKSVGGHIESFYFAFGDWDCYCIADMPDNVSAAALSLAVTASGAAETSTIPLLSADDVDKAAHKTVGYVPPGQ